MKKILFMTLIVIMIPFMIVMLFDIDNKEEIALNYVSNTLLELREWRVAILSIYLLKNI